VETYAWWAANSLRSLLPLMVKFGVATEEEIGIETFEGRYRDEVLGQGSVIRSFAAVGAWSRRATPISDSVYRRLRFVACPAWERFEGRGRARGAWNGIFFGRSQGLLSVGLPIARQGPIITRYRRIAGERGSGQR